jgi:hypothetical protein
MLVAMLPCVQCKPAADNVTIRRGGDDSNKQLQQAEGNARQEGSAH